MKTKLPVPSAPLRPEPQQYAAPLVVTPQVCIPPALMVVNVRPPSTARGMFVDLDTVPSPRCPSLPRPQQYAAPLVGTPHTAVPRPALAVVNSSPPDTGTGLGQDKGSLGFASNPPFPLPREPHPLSPQQYPAPCVVTPQLSRAPASTNANVTCTANGLLVAPARPGVVTANV